MAAPSKLSVLIKARMERLELSVATVASEVGVSAAAVYAWLASDYVPDADRYHRLAVVLEVPVASIALAAAGLDHAVEAAAS